MEDRKVKDVDFPTEIAVCVRETNLEADPDYVQGSFHNELFAEGDVSNGFLLEDDVELPENGAVVVLQCTFNRPRWWAAEATDDEARIWNLTGKYSDIYLWRIVK